jgi:hypothetical protein
MSSAPEALVLDLVEWVAKEPRAYADLLDAWRTSCPRLTVWEDALERGLVERTAAGPSGVQVAATARGRELLRANGRRYAVART